MTHTLVIKTRDKPEALNRVVSLFRRRGFNIEQLAIKPTLQPGVNRITVDVDVDNVDQLLEQVRRLVDVLTARKITGDSTADRGVFAGPHHWQADGADDNVED
jgi:acetolactate synthase I/III small subunit